MILRRNERRQAKTKSHVRPRSRFRATGEIRQSRVPGRRRGVVLILLLTGGPLSVARPDGLQIYHKQRRKSKLKKTFDEDGNLLLTPAEIDQILEQFDQAPAPLQRQIAAASLSRLAEAKELLSAIQQEAGNGLLPSTLGRISEFLN